MSPIPAIAFVILSIASLIIWSHLRAARRAEYIRSFALPNGIFERLRKQHPHLTVKDCQLVSKGLRQFFLAYLKSGRKYVSMPSQVADDLWHEYILYTKHYDQFCRKAFGQFLHHTPAAVLSTRNQSNTGLRRCWWHVCREELINPKNPTRLPLLFALDAKFDIKDGFHYVADCSFVRDQTQKNANGAAVYCGGDFSDATIDGGLDGFDTADSSSDSGGDGGGDSGCGGGCGGGD